MMDIPLPKTCRGVEMNILRSSVHLVGFIRKRLYRDARSTKHKKVNTGGSHSPPQEVKATQGQTPVHCCTKKPATASQKN